MGDWCKWKDPLSTCDVQCPEPCGKGMMSCYGGWDANGCELPDTCVEQHPGGNESCWGHCPVACGPDEITCPGGIDSWSGCPMGDWCMWKDPLSTCDVQCPMTCGKGMMHCHGGWDANGCELPGTCVEMHPGGNESCWGRCPATCGPEEITCPGGIDSWTGCPMGDWCMWKDPSSTCDVQCPVSCGKGMMHCHG